MIPFTFRRLRRHVVVPAMFVCVAFPSFAAGLKAYVGNFKDNSVSVIDTGSGTVIATVPVGAGPDGLIVTNDGKTAYVSASGANSVSVIDTATDRVAQEIETGSGPQGLAATPDGRWVLAAINGEDRVAMIDTGTRRIIATIPVAKPHTIAVAPDGARAYVASQSPGDFALVVVDLASRTVVARIALDKPPRDLEFGPDGRRLYFTLAGVAAVEVLDPSSNRVVAQIPTGVSPHVAHVFRHLDAGVIVVQGPGELQLFDPLTDARVGAVVVGRQPHWVDALPDGSQVLVTNEGSDSVTVIEMPGGATRRVAVGHAPRKIAIQPVAAGGDGSAASARVSIADFAFQPASIEISAGDSVQWSNDDGAPHGLAFQDGAAGRDLMLPGTGFSRRFDRIGIHDYTCSVHAYMTGRVVVRAP